jgi:predicted dehydrogenase
MEINFEKGSIYFNFEDLNNLYFFDATLPRKMQGWTRIQASVPGEHPYAEAWWPTAHPLGYEHTFINQTFDILQVLAGMKPVVPLASFNDAYETQRVLEAASIAAKNRCAVKMSEVK